MSSFAIASYTIVGKQKKLEDGRKINLVDIVMGNAADTYPSGGLSLSKGNLGCPVNIDSVSVIDGGAAGIDWKYDSANVKMRAFIKGAVTPAGTVAAPVFTGSALGTHTHSIPAGTDAAGGTSGATSGGTPAGTNSAPAFTGAAIAQASLAEATTAFVLPTHTIRVQVIGY